MRFLRDAERGSAGAATICAVALLPHQFPVGFWLLLLLGYNLKFTNHQYLILLALPQANQGFPWKVYLLSDLSIAAQLKDISASKVESKIVSLLSHNAFPRCFSNAVFSTLRANGSVFRTHVRLICVVGMC